MSQVERMLGCDFSWQETLPWHWTQSEQRYWRRKEGAVSQGGLALVPLDMWTAPWKMFLSHRLNPRDRLYTQGMGSSLSCGSWKERPAAYSWRLPPRPRKADEEGFQGGVWTDRLCPAAGWPEEKLAGDVVQLWDVRKCQVKYKEWMDALIVITVVGIFSVLDVISSFRGEIWSNWSYCSWSLCITALPLTAFQAESSGEEACQ